jgi:hypothetical protein
VGLALCGPAAGGRLCRPRSGRSTGPYAYALEILLGMVPESYVASVSCEGDPDRGAHRQPGAPGGFTFLCGLFGHRCGRCRRRRRGRTNVAPTSVPAFKSTVAVYTTVHTPASDHPRSLNRRLPARTLRHIGTHLGHHRRVGPWLAVLDPGRDAVWDAARLDPALRVGRVPRVLDVATRTICARSCWRR